MLLDVNDIWHSYSLCGIGVPSDRYFQRNEYNYFLEKCAANVRDNLLVPFASHIHTYFTRVTPSAINCFAFHWGSKNFLEKKKSWNSCNFQYIVKKKLQTTPVHSRSVVFCHTNATIRIKHEWFTPLMTPNKENYCSELPYLFCGCILILAFFPIHD